MDLFMRHLLRVEQMVTGTEGVEGVALRYGGWYGAGTFFARGELMHRLALKRRLPMVAARQGTWNAIHVEDAAAATVGAMSGPRGIYNVVEDQPKRWNEFVSAYCESIGAPEPRTVPSASVALGGSYLRHLVLHQMPVSNERAKRQLGWEPRHAGFGTSASRP